MFLVALLPGWRLGTLLQHPPPLFEFFDEVG
jgi:hypothetical protein